MEPTNQDVTKRPQQTPQKPTLVASDASDEYKELAKASVTQA